MKVWRETPVDAAIVDKVYLGGLGSVRFDDLRAQRGPQEAREPVEVAGPDRLAEHDPDRRPTFGGGHEIPRDLPRQIAAQPAEVEREHDHVRVERLDHPTRSAAGRQQDERVGAFVPGPFGVDTDQGPGLLERSGGSGERGREGLLCFLSPALVQKTRAAAELGFSALIR